MVLPGNIYSSGPLSTRINPHTAPLQLFLQNSYLPRVHSPSQPPIDTLPHNHLQVLSTTTIPRNHSQVLSSTTEYVSLTNTYWHSPPPPPTSQVQPPSGTLSSTTTITPDTSPPAVAAAPGTTCLPGINLTATAPPWNFKVFPLSPSPYLPLRCHSRERTRVLHDFSGHEL